jgi:hypothetical protein
VGNDGLAVDLDRRSPEGTRGRCAPDWSGGGAEGEKGAAARLDPFLKWHGGGVEKRRGGGRGATGAVPCGGAWGGARCSAGGGSQPAGARPRWQRASSTRARAAM